MKIKSKIFVISALAASFCFSITPVIAENDSLKYIGFDPSDYIYNREKTGTIPWGVKVPKYIAYGNKNQEIKIEVVALAGDINMIGTRFYLSIKHVGKDIKSNQILLHRDNLDDRIKLNFEQEKKNKKFVYVLDMNINDK